MLDVSCDEAVIKIIEALKKEGFGVLTDINVTKLLRRSLTLSSETTEFSVLVILLLLTRPCKRTTRSDRDCSFRPASVPADCTDRHVKIQSFPTINTLFTPFTLAGDCGRVLLKGC
jgi:hypothetical protein